MASFDILEIMRPVRMPATVYPLYFASQIMKALRGSVSGKSVADPEGIMVGDTELKTLGNSRYAIITSDVNNTKYRITVEVVS